MWKDRSHTRRLLSSLRDRADRADDLLKIFTARRSLLVAQRRNRREIANREIGAARQRANAKTPDDRLNRTDYRTTAFGALLHPEGVRGGAGRGRPTATERCRSGSLHRKLRGLQLSIPAFVVHDAHCARCGWHGNAVAASFAETARIIKPTDR